MENKWREIRQARCARLAPKAPAAHRILMRFSKCARSTSRASALLQRCRGLRGAAAFGRGTADAAASGRAGASGASSTFLSMQVCCRSGASHARLLARSGAAAFGAAAFGRSTSGGAASGRTGASGASQRGRRPHCGAAESGFTGRRRRLGRALYPPTDVKL